MTSHPPLIEQEKRKVKGKEDLFAPLCLLTNGSTVVETSARENRAY